MIFNKYCFSVLLTTLLSLSSAGRVSVVDAVTHAPLFTPRNNVLSYPAALSGAAGIGPPSFRVVGHYKEVILPTAKTDINIEPEDEEATQSQAQSEFRPKFINPPDSIRKETRPYRQAPQQFSPPIVGHVNAHGFRLPSSNVETPASAQALRVFPLSVETGPQTFQAPQHTEQSGPQPQYTLHNVESEESDDYADAPESSSSYDLSPQVEGLKVATDEQKSYQEPHHDSHEVEDVKSAKYEFMYRVEDHEYHPVSSGDDKDLRSDFGHSEARDGEKTWGRYFVKLPDGRVQTVRYWADHSGYHAEVQFEGKAKHPEPVKKHHHSPVKSALTSIHQNQPQYSSSEDITHLLPSYEAYTDSEHKEDEAVEDSSHGKSEER